MATPLVVNTMGLYSCDQNCAYSSCCYTPWSTGYQLGLNRASQKEVGGQRLNQVAKSALSEGCGFKSQSLQSFIPLKFLLKSTHLYLNLRVLLFMRQMFNIIISHLQLWHNVPDLSKSNLLKRKSYGSVF